MSLACGTYNVFLNGRVQFELTRMDTHTQRAINRYCSKERDSDIPYTLAPHSLVLSEVFVVVVVVFAGGGRSSFCAPSYSVLSGSSVQWFVLSHDGKL